MMLRALSTAKEYTLCTLTEEYLYAYAWPFVFVNKV